MRKKTSSIVMVRKAPQDSDSILHTPHQYQTQVRFWIPLKIPTDHDYMMPRLPENAKIKIP